MYWDNNLHLHADDRWSGSTQEMIGKSKVIKQKLPNKIYDCELYNIL